MISGPKPYPCVSCPYRRDVPSGVWTEEEYVKLPQYDQPTWAQPPQVFCCHQDDDTICSGWAATHDGANLLSLRMAASFDRMAPGAVDATIDYESPVPVFDSGEDAAAHGLHDLKAPGEGARKLMLKVERRRARRG